MFCLRAGKWNLQETWSTSALDFLLWIHFLHEKTPYLLFTQGGLRDEAFSELCWDVRSLWGPLNTKRNPHYATKAHLLIRSLPVCLSPPACLGRLTEEKVVVSEEAGQGGDSRMCQDLDLEAGFDSVAYRQCFLCHWRPAEGQDLQPGGRWHWQDLKKGKIWSRFKIRENSSINLRALIGFTGFCVCPQMKLTNTQGVTVPIIRRWKHHRRSFWKEVCDT